MKVSLNWLSQYVDVPSDTKAFCDRLDLTGTGVEGVERTGASFDHVVTAQVVEKKPHPDSDHMWVTKVDVGKYNLGEDGAPEPLQIVCGAQNFNEGDHIVTALIGAHLPGDVHIKKSKLRGVVSWGMNCSARELGLGSDHAGIMILPADAPVGMPLADYLKLSDTVLDLEITPNRPDCLSMCGMAREVGAMYRKDVTYPLYELTEDETLPAASDLVDVDIADPDRSRRYSLRVIQDVHVGPSPDWLAQRVTGRRRALHQQHRRRDQLHHVPVRPAASRLRLRQGEGRRRQGAHRRARRARRREADHARRHRAHADAGHDRHRHARAPHRAGRRHGRA
jgi:phenylalanyl-tRNA synthetase beta chain